MDAYCLTRLIAPRKTNTEGNTELAMDVVVSTVRPAMPATWTVAAVAVFRKDGIVLKRVDSVEASGRFFGTVDGLVVALRRLQQQLPD